MHTAQNGTKYGSSQMQNCLVSDGNCTIIRLKNIRVASTDEINAWH